MNENFDIMHAESVAIYENFANVYYQNVEDVIAEINKMVELLEGCEKNLNTERLENFFESMAQCIYKATSTSADIYDECLRELDEKATALKSALQTDYNGRLKVGAAKWRDLTKVKEVSAGNKPFDRETFDEFLDKRIIDFVNVWEDRLVMDIENRAMEISDNPNQDEMSKIVPQIAEAMKKAFIEVEDAAATLCEKYDELRGQHKERKQKFTSRAQDEMSSFNSNMKSMLGDVLDDLTDIVF